MFATSNRAVPAREKVTSTRNRPPKRSPALIPHHAQCRSAFPDDGHHVEQFSDWSTPADELIERDQTRTTVRACINRLPDNYREVLILRDIEELSTGDVARLLAMTPTAVKVRLHRARQALSTLLRKEFART